jgi:DNA-binding NtrC family response regulator
MNVLVVDDEPMVRRSLGRSIARAWRDTHIASAASLPEAERALAETRPDVVTVDLGLDRDRSLLHGLRLVECVANQGRASHAVVVTGREDAVDAAHRAGAKVVLLKPVGDAELRGVGRRLGIPLVGDDDSLRADAAPLAGASRAMQELREAVRRVEGENGPVLIEGETGTGKELVARAIHGRHGKGPFHPVNCSTLESLAESQLFGHARGAFTSAERCARGAIEQAGDGVLFLDEIGDLAKPIQAKLLRVLEGSAVQPLGDERWIELRARLVAACHVDLEACVKAGTFRDDLYYRLAVHVIRVPPLRERAEDLPVLVPALLRRLRRPKRVTEDALALLATRPWPGNVRELAGLLERAAVYSCDDMIDADDVLAVERATRLVGPAGPAKALVGDSLGRFGIERDALARQFFEQALRGIRSTKRVPSRPPQQA